MSRRSGVHGWRRTAIATLVAIAATSCGGGGSDEGAATTARPEAEEPVDAGETSTALDSLAALLDDDGLLDVEAARMLFAATVAPLDGVEPDAELLAAAETGDVEPGMAIRAMVEHWDELDDADRAVLDEIAYVPGESALDDGVVIDPPARPASAAASEDTGSRIVQTGLPRVGVDDQEAVVRAVLGDLQARLGRPLYLPVVVVPMDVAEAERRFGPTVQAYAELLSDAEDRPTQCVVRLRPDADLTGVGRGSVAHELFHCFQYDILGGPTGVMPAWVTEGSAAWVGEMYIGGGEGSRGWWPRWLVSPHLGLRSRSYDAIGLFSLAQASGVDVWSRLLAVVAGPDRLGALLGAESDAILARWGPSVAREPGWSSIWDTVGPGVPPEQAAAPTAYPLPRPDADPLVIHNVLGANAAGRLLSFDLAGDIVTFQVNGLHGQLRLADNTQFEVRPGRSIPLCLLEGGCTCPDSGEAPIEAHAGTAGEAVLGLASLTSGGSVEVSVRSLEAMCEEPPPTTEAAESGSCFVGEWVSGPWTVPFGEPSGGSGIRLDLRADGTGHVDYDGMEAVRFTSDDIVDVPVEVKTDVLYQGQGGVTWTGDAGGLRIVYDDLGQFRIWSQTLFGPQVVSSDRRSFAELVNDPAARIPLDGAAQVRCVDGGWVLTMPMGDGAMEIPYQSR